MYDEIIQIREIRDDENGAEKVNSLLKKDGNSFPLAKLGL